MPAVDRYKLLGNYRTPRFKYGDVVLCEVRGYVKIIALSSGCIPWPKCRVGKSHAIIVYAGLADAVRRESSHAVRHWWGVGLDAVWRWRKALTVARTTAGTLDLMSRNSKETITLPSVRKALARAGRSPERAAKIAAAKRGVPRPHGALDAAHDANRGRVVTKAQRRKMSESHKRRGTIPPAMKGPAWTDAEDAVLGTMADADVAARTGRTVAAVQSRRYVLRVERWRG